MFFLKYLSPDTSKFDFGKTCFLPFCQHFQVADPETIHGKQAKKFYFIWKQKPLRFNMNMVSRCCGHQLRQYMHLQVTHKKEEKNCQFETPAILRIIFFIPQFFVYHHFFINFLTLQNKVTQFRSPPLFQARNEPFPVFFLPNVGGTPTFCFTPSPNKLRVFTLKKFQQNNTNVLFSFTKIPPPTCWRVTYKILQTPTSVVGSFFVQNIMNVYNNFPNFFQQKPFYFFNYPNFTNISTPLMKSRNSPPAIFEKF